MTLDGGAEPIRPSIERQSRRTNRRFYAMLKTLWTAVKILYVRAWRKVWGIK